MPKRHFKTTHSERRAIEKAMEQGVKVRAKRGKRNIPNDRTDARYPSTLDQRTWKVANTKRKHQYREDIIENIIKKAVLGGRAAMHKMANQDPKYRAQKLLKMKPAARNVVATAKEKAAIKRGLAKRRARSF